MSRLSNNKTIPLAMRFSSSCLKAGNNTRISLKSGLAGPASYTSLRKFELPLVGTEERSGCGTDRRNEILQSYLLLSIPIIPQ